jgi:hypothetical protein
MRVTPGVGIAIGLGAVGVIAGGVAIANFLGGDDHDGRSVGRVPNPTPGPSPTPPSGDDHVPTPDVPFPTETGPQPWTQPTRVDGLVDRYMELYDHSGDGEIDLGWGQQFGDDERVTGDVGNIHTMVEFFRDADTDGNKLLTRDELRGAIAAFDTQGTIGFNPSAPELGDGILGTYELLRYKQDAIQAHSDPLDYVDTKGVPQMLLDEDGNNVNNEGFFHALPDYRALTGGVEPRR